MTDHSNGTTAGRRGGTLSLVILVLMVAAVLGVAWMVVSGMQERGLPGFEATQRQTLLPGLRDRLDEVTGVEIAGAEGSLVLRRDEGTWRIAELAGYPARDGLVADLLAQLAGLEAIYVSETRQPDYAGLALAAPEAGSPGAGVAIAVHGTAEEPLARVVVGEHMATPGGTSLTNTAVRRGDDPRAWLVDAEIRVPVQPLAWTWPEIVDVPPSQVLRIDLTTPEGERFVAARPEGRDVLQVIEGGGRAGADDLSTLEMMAAALESLRFEAVRQAEQAPGDVRREWHSAITARDGLTYRTRLFEQQDAFWAAIAAEPAQEGEATARAAAAFNQRHGGWLYRLPAYAGEQLTGRPAATREE